MAEGADKLRKLLADPTITEIMVNGPKATWLEVKGTKYKIEVTFSEEDLKDIIDVFFTRVGKNISYYNPYGDVCTEDGSRLNIIQYPLSRCGTTLTVRKFDRQLHSLAPPQLSTPMELVHCIIVLVAPSSTESPKPS